MGTTDSLPAPKVARRIPIPDDWVVCQACGYLGAPNKIDAIQAILVVVLLLFMILPGLIYLLYIVSRKSQCPKCSQRQTIPVDTPNGRELAEAARAKHPTA